MDISKTKTGYRNYFKCFHHSYCHRCNLLFSLISLHQFIINIY
jgi:hypothetical protein